MRVSGRRRVPSPPASRTPFISEDPARPRTDARTAVAELVERRQPEVVPVERALAELAEPDERELDAEEPLVRIELVRDTRLDDPAVAARDDPQEVVALEEVRPGELRIAALVGDDVALRVDDDRVVEREAGEEIEPDVLAEPDVDRAVHLVHAVGALEGECVAP